MTENELRRFEARRALRDISAWGAKLAEKLGSAFSYTRVQLQVLRIECDAFEESCNELRTKFPEYIHADMRARMERFSLILNTIDWKA